MVLLLALVIPFIIGFVIYAAAGRRITARELGVQLGAVALVVLVSYFTMTWRNTSDVQLINGTIATRTRESTGCCHSYRCHCHQVCSGSGSSRSCSEECDTCYEHSHDIEWSATSTTGRTVYDNDCNAPGTPTPPRWASIYVGEPTAEESSFTNYIKANPTTILRRQAVAPALLAQVPEYPRVYDHYRARRVLVLGVQGVDVAAMDHELSFINSQLGPKRQVDIIVIITNESDQTFGEAVRQKWLGGKKNDVVVVIGAPSFPQVSWVDVVSWTPSEAMKIQIRDGILGHQPFDGRYALGVIAHEVDQGFQRRHMREFKYLAAGIEPTTGQTIALFIIALVICLAGSFLMYRVDLFDEEARARRANPYPRRFR